MDAAEPQVELNYRQQYYKDNREKELRQGRKYYQANKERLKRRRKKYYESNKEKLIKYQKQWRKANPHKVAVQTERRVQYIKESQPIWYECELVKQLYQKRNELNQLWETSFQVDHIIPIISDSVCGLHCWDNLQLLDATHNNSKSNFYETDW